MSSSHGRRRRGAVAWLCGAVAAISCIGIAPSEGTAQPTIARDTSARGRQFEAWTSLIRNTPTVSVVPHWAGESVRTAALRFSYFVAQLPEYDDQQLVPNGCRKQDCTPSEYGPMLTAFAADHLERWETVDFVHAGDIGLPVAEICAERDYSPLGLHETSTTGAGKCTDANVVIVISPDTINWYAAVLHPNPASGTVDTTYLQVERVTFGDDDFCTKKQKACGEDIPPTVRFDWVHGAPAISVRCGLGWCDVLDTGVVAGTGTSPGSTTSSRVARVKGWHDSQYLMEKTGGYEKPSKTFMTVTPVEDLATITRPRFRAAWNEVASIDNPVDYKEETDAQGNKAPLFRGSNGITRNAVELKLNGNVWVWRLVYYQGATAIGTSQIHKVKFTEHSGIPTVAAARWRWSSTDEMIWTRCANGCCELLDQ